MLSDSEDRWRKVLPFHHPVLSSMGLWNISCKCLQNCKFQFNCIMILDSVNPSHQSSKKHSYFLSAGLEGYIYNLKPWKMTARDLLFEWWNKPQNKGREDTKRFTTPQKIKHVLPSFPEGHLRPSGIRSPKKSTPRDSILAPNLLLLTPPHAPIIILIAGCTKTSSNKTPKFHMEVEHAVLDKEHSKVGSSWWTFKLPIPVCQFLSWFRWCNMFFHHIGFETPKYSISWGPKTGKIVSPKYPCLQFICCIPFYDRNSPWYKHDMYINVNNI